MPRPIRLLARGSSHGHADRMIDIPGKNSLQNSCERQERLLAEKRGALGEDHPEVLTAMLDLADCLWAQGRLIAARNLEEQVVEGRPLAIGRAPRGHTKGDREARRHLGRSG
jgi:Tetratricopeptide repeat